MTRNPKRTIPNSGLLLPYTQKPDKDITRKENCSLLLFMNISVTYRSFYMRNEVIPGIKGCFNIKKSINVQYHIKKINTSYDHHKRCPKYMTKFSKL